MPARTIGGGELGRRRLAQQLGGVVLPEVGLAELAREQDGLGPEALGDRDECHSVGIDQRLVDRARSTLAAVAGEDADATGRSAT